MAPPTPRQLLTERRIVVVCGAGGVGKTSISAAMALAAARLGRAVLVITIDPSRRLAEVLGVARNAPAPVQLDAGRLLQAGVRGPGALSAWMLDPKRVADDVVRRLAPPGEVQLLLGNHVYRHVSAMVSGMQEYAALEAVHQYLQTRRYDLIVLDTPPSRNALQFLTAPRRLGNFLNPRVLRLFTPGPTSRLREAARRIFYRIIDASLGQQTGQELQEFLSIFTDILLHQNSNAGHVQELFHQPDAAFVVVAAPTPEALAEATYFERTTRDALGLNLQGYLLNCSLATRQGLAGPEALLAEADDGVLAEALRKLLPLARQEQELAARHRAFLDRLAGLAGPERLTLALPCLPHGVTDLRSLTTLARALLAA